MYSLMEVERVGDAYDKPAEYCDDITGFHAKAWTTEITPWGKENVRAYNDWR